MRYIKNKVLKIVYTVIVERSLNQRHKPEKILKTNNNIIN